jgi:hypothetical protein
MDHFEEKVRLRAYEIWEREGYAGDPEDHWLRAERELKSDQETHEGSPDRPAVTVEDASPSDAVATADAATGGASITSPSGGTAASPASQRRNPVRGRSERGSGG